MIEIVSLIISKGDPTWIQTVKNCIRCPGLDSKDFQKLLLDQDGPRFMATHLPIQMFPKSYFTSKAKIIYVIRNPRDIVTSSYYIRKQLYHLKIQMTFEEHLLAFIEGDVTWGSWFDHSIGWLTRRDTAKFLFMSYEELQRVILFHCAPTSPSAFLPFLSFLFFNC
ncbi:Sulfotransferase 2A1 [Lemmus lemmus]